jgi:site-specific DNA-methyltransferase (adenine-specific)
MLFASSEKGFTVCDPFLGSGSCAIAAIKNNCNFIGCDISEKSISVSKKRIEGFINTKIDNLQKNPNSIENEKVFWE